MNSRILSETGGKCVRSWRNVTREWRKHVSERSPMLAERCQILAENGQCLADTCLWPRREAHWKARQGEAQACNLYGSTASLHPMRN